jgi:hypothetical protein
MERPRFRRLGGVAAGMMPELAVSCTVCAFLQGAKGFERDYLAG